MFNGKMAIYTALLVILLWFIPNFLHIGILGIVLKGAALIMGGLLIISTIAGVMSNIKDKFRR